MDAQQLFDELMHDPGFRQVYEEMAPEFQIATQVIKLRTDRGWTQQELAARLGTGQANVSRLENAVGTPSFSLLKRVARVFGLRLWVTFVEATAVAAPAGVELEAVPVHEDEPPYRADDPAQ